jgi:uncharacterized protein YqjF (DUF2071 family)
LPASSHFITDEWRHLAIASYIVDPDALTRHLPSGTELDLWNGKCYVSLVAFRFENTRVRGVRIPWHTDFEEINLRFYVRRHDGVEWKRGVVFIKEIVPKFAIAFVARTLFGENYVQMGTASQLIKGGNQITVAYQWQDHRLHRFAVSATDILEEIASGSEAEFITEHYWGYTRRSIEQTSEYLVEHPRWKTYPVIDFEIDVAFGSLYGAEFTSLSREEPVSVMLAEGSEVQVGKAVDEFYPPSQPQADSDGRNA